MDGNRMNEVFYEMIRWQPALRMNMAICLLNSLIAEDQTGLVDGGVFDRTAQRDVYLVGGVGASAGLLRLQAAGLVREHCGARATIKEGEEATPCSKPIERRFP